MYTSNSSQLFVYISKIWQRINIQFLTQKRITKKKYQFSWFFFSFKKVSYLFINMKTKSAMCFHLLNQSQLFVYILKLVNYLFTFKKSQSATYFHLWIQCQKIKNFKIFFAPKFKWCCLPVMLPLSLVFVRDHRCHVQDDGNRLFPTWKQRLNESKPQKIVIHILLWWHLKWVQVVIFDKFCLFTTVD